MSKKKKHTVLFQLHYHIDTIICPIGYSCSSFTSPEFSKKAPGYHLWVACRKTSRKWHLHLGVTRLGRTSGPAVLEDLDESLWFRISY